MEVPSQLKDYAHSGHGGLSGITHAATQLLAGARTGIKRWIAKRWIILTKHLFGGENTGQGPRFEPIGGGGWQPVKAHSTGVDEGVQHRPCTGSAITGWSIHSDADSSPTRTK